MADSLSLRSLLNSAWKGLSKGSNTTNANAQQENVRLVIGFDFGTSTSKVIVSGYIPRTGQYRRSVLQVDGSTLIPSTVWQRDGRLSFSPPPPGRPYVASIKSALGRSPCGATINRHATETTGVSAEILCYGYLTYLSRHTLNHIAREWPESQYNITESIWSMGAPLGLCKWKEGSTVYRKILQAALDFPAPIDDSGNCLGADLIHAYSLATVTPRRADCAIIPEALVTISSIALVTQGRIDPGMYCLIDVGAGTTDATWFRYSPKNPENPMLIYSGATTPIAGDLINTALHTIKPTKVHKGWQPIPGIKPQPLNTLLNDLAAIRGEGMKQIGRREPISAFMNEPVSLVLMGGGSLIREVKDVLKNNLMSISNPGTTRARFRYTTEFQSVHHHLHGASPLHGIALGLSYHPGEHPGFLDRHEIVDWIPAQRTGAEFLDHNLIDD